MTENEARKAFNAAQKNLDDAMQEYRKTGAALRKFTGENHGADPSVSLRFNDARAGVTEGSYNKADC